ncbi:heavy-metal-associated domain-containing protein [Aquabacterium sp.]|uniref:heavy-metal-associated domain-containing protein n=1 Tax=Aquabacterium sp. TaxID=1872578 RepID=UPI0035AE979A
MSSTQHHQLTVKGMSCQHCVKAVTRAIQDKDPQAGVEVTLPEGKVSVATSLDRNTVAALITEEGYEVLS